MHFARWLKKIRGELGMTQNETAAILGLGRTYYLELESGQKKPTVIEALGIPVRLEEEKLRKKIK